MKRRLLKVFYGSKVDPVYNQSVCLTPNYGILCHMSQFAGRENELRNTQSMNRTQQSSSKINKYFDAELLIVSNRRVLLRCV